jgi:hypothetical protein
VFDLYGNERLTEWKSVRNEIEISDTPYQIVANLWSRAPFVNPYLDSQNPKIWPDPWKLILDGKFDDLAIALGMLYTLKLTDRFMTTPCEIHMSMLGEGKDQKFFIVVDNEYVLNYQIRTVLSLKTIKENSIKLWSTVQLP